MKRARGDWVLRFLIPAVLLASMAFAKSSSNGGSCPGGYCSPPIPAPK